jgi:hypothetical protein
MRRRGYSLPLVLLVLTTLSLGMVSLTTVLADSARTSGSLAGRRRTLYACDGVARALAITAGEYLKGAPNPTTAELRQAICGNTTGPSCPLATNWMPDYTMDSVELTTGAVNVLREIPNGPFAGQTSRRTDLAITVAMTHSSGRACRVTQRMVNGQIGLFQFAVFSGVPMDLFNPPPMTLTGRTHINGDFCAGGADQVLTIERLTVSGNIRSGCHGGSKALMPRGGISTDGFRATNRATPNQDGPMLSSGNDSVITGWRERALSLWGGNVLDAAHEVPQLRLPVALSTEAQPGQDQDGAPRTNLDTLRVMVDPPRDSDTPETRAERLFNKADIRIINGVWYLRNLNQVIWSDHTGGVDANAEDNELTSLRVPGSISAAPAGPTRFSYYERNSVGAVENKASTTSGQPANSIVSYGALVKVGDNNWRPGITSAVTNNGAGGDAAALVEATKTGFLDRRIAIEEGRPANQRMGDARILPLNFDVRAFIEAMSDTTPGELGSHFQGGARFNGIIWIGNSWPEHDRGFTASAAASTRARLAPVRGSYTDDRNPGPPLPLCKKNIASSDAPLAGGHPQSVCTALDLPRVNAVRVINAKTINPNLFPRGLTIATNGPLYTLGDVNSDSLRSDNEPETPRLDSPSGRWVPLMLAGDAITMLSNGWPRDYHADHAWGGCQAATCTGTPGDVREVRTCANHPADDATATRVAAAIVAGQVDTASTWGGGINNFPRFLECWTDVPHVIVGSLVIGFRSVYQRQPYHLYSYRPPDRDWGFDRNLESPARQPPGTPMFFVQAIERWERD